MKKHMKTERKKNLERGYSHISLKEKSESENMICRAGWLFTIYAKQTLSS